MAFTSGSGSPQFALEEAPERVVTGIAASLCHSVERIIRMRLAILLDLMDTELLDDVDQSHSQIELNGTCQLAFIYCKICCYPLTLNYFVT